MRPLRIGVVTVIALLVLAGLAGATSYVRSYKRYRGFAPPQAPPGVPRGRVVRVYFDSPALHQRRSYLIYEPADYARLGRLPVLYLLHPPPAPPGSYIRAGALAVDEDELIQAHAIRPMFVVLPDGRSGSYGNDTEWANADAGRYEDFVIDVVHAVDRRFPTLADRRDRVIGGLSEGGYGATNIALHHLSLFGGLQSWSGYYRNSVGYSPVFAGRASELAYNSPSLYVPRVARRIRALGLHAFLYVGTVDREPGHAEMAGFASELRRAGAQVGDAVWPGGHDWGLWRAHLRQMLELASRWFSS